MLWVINIVLSLVLAVVMHELGHCLAGRAAGLNTRFGVKWREVFGLRYPNPCVRFDGEATERQLRVFGISGFGAEFATLTGLVIAQYCGIFSHAESMYVVTYAVIATAHFISYPFRNTGLEDNDFRYLN